MPPKAVPPTNDKFFLAIIETMAGISGVKWDTVSEKLGGEKTANAIRKQFIRIKEKVEKEQGPGTGGGDAAGEDYGSAVQPATAKKKRAPAKSSSKEPQEAQDRGRCA